MFTEIGQKRNQLITLVKTKSLFVSHFIKVNHLWKGYWLSYRLAILLICSAGSLISQEQTSRSDDLSTYKVFRTERNSKKRAALGKEALSKFSTSKKGDSLFVSCCRRLSYIYTDDGRPDSALKYLQIGLDRAEDKNDKAILSMAYAGYASYYYFSNDRSKGVSYTLKQLKIYEELKDSTEIARASSNIGIFYSSMEQYSQALRYYRESERIRLLRKDFKNLSNNYIQIGSYFFNVSNFDSSIVYYNKALNLVDKYGSHLQDAYVNIYSGLAEAYEEKGVYTEAIINAEKSLNHAGEIKLERAISLAYQLLGDIYKKKEDYKYALLYYQKGLRSAQKAQISSSISYSHQGLSTVYKRVGNFEKAYKHLSLHKAIADSINSEQRNEDFARYTAEYRSDKRQREIQLLTKEKQISSLENRAQESRIRQFKFVIIISVIGALFLILSIILVYRKYANNRKLNYELEYKNSQITESIVYAKRIQTSLLPSKFSLVEPFQESFVLFLPRDIVSGDFYWIATIQDITITVVADCTGHGIPGAFLSIIGNTLLNEIVIQNDVTEPDKILSKLDHGFITLLGQTNMNLDTQEDGMDVAVISYDKGRNSMQFAGANQQMIVVKNGNVKTIDGSYFSIGGFYRNRQKKFTNNVLADIEEGTMIYLFSDGYADQFGGSEDKKLMRARFLELLVKFEKIPTAAQSAALLKEHRNWKGDKKQTDDILVLGLRV